MQFGLVWILLFTLACGLYFAAVKGAGNDWWIVVIAGGVTFMLALGGLLLCVLVVERCQSWEVRHRRMPPHSPPPEGEQPRDITIVLD